jgi:hypothetical protein
MTCKLKNKSMVYSLRLLHIPVGSFLYVILYEVTLGIFKTTDTLNITDSNDVTYISNTLLYMSAYFSVILKKNAKPICSVHSIQVH